MPDWRAEVRRRLGAARLDGAAEEQIAEELAEHLADVYAERRAAGASHEAAVAAALAELEDAGESAAQQKAAAGDVALGVRVRGSVRPRPEPLATGSAALGGGGWLAGLGSDLRHALRSLARAPVFTGIAMLVIALGIGANTAIFSVVNSVLLRPVPGARAPQELVTIFTSDYSGPRYGASSYPDVQAFAAARDVFSGVAAHSPIMLSLHDGDRVERLLGEAVTQSYFETLGVRPALGRFFLPEERIGAGSVTSVVISHELWQSRFGGDRAVLGAPLRVNGQVLTVVGVAPAEFRGMLRGARMALWVPFSAPRQVHGRNPDERGDRGLFVFARLASGADVASASARLRVIAAQLHQAYPDYWTDVNDRARVVTVLPEIGSARAARAAHGGAGLHDAAAGGGGHGAAHRLHQHREPPARACCHASR